MRSRIPLLESLFPIALALGVLGCSSPITKRAPLRYPAHQGPQFRVQEELLLGTLNQPSGDSQALRVLRVTLQAGPTEALPLGPTVLSIRVKGATLSAGGRPGLDLLTTPLSGGDFVPALIVYGPLALVALPFVALMESGGNAVNRSLMMRQAMTWESLPAGGIRTGLIFLRAPLEVEVEVELSIGKEGAPPLRVVVPALRSVPVSSVRDEVAFLGQGKH